MIQENISMEEIVIMKKLTMVLMFFCVGAVFFGANLTKQFELRQTIQDIQSLNLIIGLNLTKNQLNQLININKKIENTISSIESRMDVMNSKYKEFKEGLIKDGFELDKKLMSETGKLHREEIDFKEEFKKLNKESFKKAEAILTDAQKKVLENYKPCLLPTKDLRNPARIGQAGHGSHFINMLRRSRNVPDEKLEEMIERIWKKSERKVRRKLKDDSAVKKHKDVLIEVIAEARNMSEAEFEINKEFLIKRIIPEKPKKEFKKHGPGKVRFLVRPGLVAIYQKLLAK